ncbi:MAG TPA: quaternary ammonium compound efflux SMR transporter SugE [Ignavibacteria bacterium]|jgi:quaternary ammonium compound-resistance protein SugE|nr:quaternary ammonium compound efflux SMR transporter SugE [Ignavibacteria bacterium]
MYWFYLIIAGLFEVTWAIGLKMTDGWSKLFPSIFTVIFMIASFAMLSLALKQLPIGTAYAVWTGIGAAGTALIAMIFLGESVSVSKIIFLGLIIIGIIGLKLTSPE